MRGKERRSVWLVHDKSTEKVEPEEVEEPGKT